MTDANDPTNKRIAGLMGGLIEALRRAEKDASDAWFAIHNEATDAAKAYHAQSSRHQQQLRAIEQVGYDRGLADAKAHPETLGLADASIITELMAAREALKPLERTVDFVTRWAWRDSPGLTDEERLSAIKYYPPIKARVDGWSGPGTTPHEYQPDLSQFGGDCAICGHTYDAHSDRAALELREKNRG